MTISDTLRQRLREELKARTLYAIAKEAKLNWKTLSRFNDGAGMRSEHIDSLASYFGLALTPTKKPKGK